jgi:hypothetical protein
LGEEREKARASAFRQLLSRIALGFAGQFSFKFLNVIQSSPVEQGLCASVHPDYMLLVAVISELPE